MNDTPYRPGDQLPAEEVNRLIEETARLGIFTGPSTSSDPTGQHIVPEPPDSYWGEIVELATDDTAKYGWKEKQDKNDAISSGLMITAPCGITGTVTPLVHPAWEVSGNKMVPLGAIVRVWRGQGNHFWFIAPSGGIAVEEEGGLRINPTRLLTFESEDFDVTVGPAGPDNAFVRTEGVTEAITVVTGFDPTTCVATTRVLNFVRGLLDSTSPGLSASPRSRYVSSPQLPSFFPGSASRRGPGNG